MPNTNTSTYKDYGDGTRRTETWYVPEGPPHVTSRTLTSPHVYQAEYRAGSKTPNYSKRLEAGMLPVNPFHYEVTLVTYPKLSARMFDSRYPITQETFDGNLSPSEGVCTFLATNGLYTRNDLIDSAYNESVARFLADIKSQKINIAQFVAERKQTINLIASSAQKIAGFLLALKKGDIISAGKALGSRPSRRIRRGFRELHPQSVRDATADAWLAMQYGWRPLLSDIYGATQLLAERASDFERHVAKSKAVRMDTVNTTVGGLHGTWKCKTEFRVVVKHTGIFDVTQSTLNGLANVGLTNPAQLAWELVPYSFVVDWFLPIGNYLASLDATAGVTLSEGSLVVYEKWRCQAEYVPHSSGYGVVYEGSGSGYSSKTRVVRSRFTSFPTPPLPQLKNPFSVEHALNALALISGAVSRRR